jgi:redox-sensitive bicupin YhaK (pirin superfamily)
MNPPGIEQVVVPAVRDLGDGFQVRRALPCPERQMVGPFIFLDQMGPMSLKVGQGLDVRPHPHIGLATLTYLLEGELLHRDSLGHVQAIRPGDVNWMVAGRGIVHSERTPATARALGGRLSGLQCWLALPRAHEETAPSFVHHPGSAIPAVEGEGLRVRVIAGASFGARSPVSTFSDTLFAHAELEESARLAIPPTHEERALYVTEGQLEVDGQTFPQGQLVVLRPGEEIVVSAPRATQLVLVGGAAMDGPRTVWWNFVSSSNERLRQAKEDWRAKRFGQVPDETEFIPLPEDPPPAVRYP